ncbi:Undecaprenyl-phosphate N-acetylglucosaminyl 1-phosphate transferase [hydrothermal vent metagenome]|uniref:Undecaprenyl-phosphate N-acetylglucosaminyl 1-phosphate transferase n=1 Tax=hydrothermal vent metagenome TaxID=652676 RepID=A0A1W1BIY8_9ZZZZ
MVLSILFIKLIVKYAHKLDLYDVPNERSHHCSITPSGAGIGFISALFFSFVVFEFSFVQEYWYIFVSIAIVFAMGVYDDRHAVSARLKFIAIFLAVFLLWINDCSIYTFGTWYGHELVIPSVFALLFSLFALSGFTNALNLIDGIDGLSASVSIVILTFFAFLGFEYHSDIIVLLSTFTIASLIGFLFLNWHPAKIFMGDSGSLTIGFIICVLAVLSLEYVHPVALVYLMALPLLDTLMVMLRRMKSGKSPFSPDKTHIHHMLVKCFETNVPQTVGFLVVLQIVFSAIGYMILDSINKNGGTNLPVFALLGFIFIFILFYMVFAKINTRQLLIDTQEDEKVKSVSL